MGLLTLILSTLIQSPLWIIILWITCITTGIVFTMSMPNKLYSIKCEYIPEDTIPGCVKTVMFYGKLSSHIKKQYPTYGTLRRFLIKISILFMTDAWIVFSSIVSLFIAMGLLIYELVKLVKSLF